MVYWLVSDNLLAYYALRNDDPTISNEIASTLKNYATSYNLPHDSNGFPTSFKHEAIIGDVLSEEFKNSTIIPIENSSNYTIVTEVDNNTSTNESGYADLLALRGLSFCNSNQPSEATLRYDEMMKMWDGYGFVDDAFN